MSRWSGTGPTRVTAAWNGRGMLALLVTLVAAGACEWGKTTTVGVASSPEGMAAARLAILEAMAAEPIEDLDTLFIPEVDLAISPVRVATDLAGTPGIIAVIGHVNSTASIAASPIYNQHEIVQIAPNSTAALYSEMGPYSFRTVPPDDRQGAFLAGLLEETLPRGATIALLYNNDDYGRGLRSALLAKLDTTLYPIVLDLPHTQDDESEEDFAHASRAVAETDPGAIVWIALGTTLDSFLRGFRGLHRRPIPVIGSDAVATGAPLGDAPPHWEGVRYVDFVDLEGSQAVREFRRRYETRFGRLPTGPDALHYDAVGVVLAGIRAGARTGPDLRRYLVSLGRDRPPFPGLTGPITFDDEGDVERSYLVRVVEVREEKR